MTFQQLKRSGLLVLAMTLAAQEPKNYSGLREVRGESRIVILAEGQREKRTPIRTYGEWTPYEKESVIGTCTIGRDGGGAISRMWGGTKDQCYQDGELMESADPPNVQEMRMLKYDVESMDRRNRFLMKEIQKLLPACPAKEEFFETWPKNNNYSAMFTCSYDKPEWELIVMATSGCILTESAAKAMEVDDENGRRIKKWWSECN